MSWPIKALVASLSLSIALPALAESTVAPAVFISEVELITSWKNDPGVERSQIETFKELLRLHGYQTDDCQENAEAWQRIASRTTTPNDIETYRKLDERLVAAQKCSVPASATRAYNVKLILNYDPLLKNRRALLHLIALGDYDSLDGGYAHKPGALIGWYELMDRAIERTIRRYNDHTAIRVRAPKEADVGDTVRIDGRSSWDPDGDAFELRWKVVAKACIGKAENLPVDELDCPDGMKVGEAPIPNQAAGADFTREFRAPMIGDYRIDVHSKIGAREEPARSYTLRVYPRRAWTFFARVGLLRLPKYFLSDTKSQKVGLIQGLGLARRFIHRIGFFGLYEEVHIGFSLDVVQQISRLSYDSASNVLFSLDTIARVLNRTGRYGVGTTSVFSYGIATAERGRGEREEETVVVSFLIGFYYVFGNNYLDKASSFCADMCPSITVGPVFDTLVNIDAGRAGISLGGQLIAQLEF